MVISAGKTQEEEITLLILIFRLIFPPLLLPQEEGEEAALRRRRRRVGERRRMLKFSLDHSHQGQLEEEEEEVGAPAALQVPDKRPLTKAQLVLLRLLPRRLLVRKLVPSGGQTVLLLALE